MQERPQIDRNLVEKVKSGDMAAFRELFDYYQKKVYLICFGMLRNHEDAMDMVQETFLKTYKSLQYFRYESNFYTWVYRIASNACLDFLRKKKRRGKSEPLAEDLKKDPEDTGREGAVLTSTDDPHRTVVSREVGARIEEAINSLPPDHRAIVMLREVEQLSYEEIAKTLGIRVGTVMSRLFYARKKLQEKLKHL